MNEQGDAVVQALIDIGNLHAKTPSQVALAWLLAQPEITSVISGPDTPAHLDDVIGACGWTLGEAEVAQLATLSRPATALHIG